MRYETWEALSAAEKTSLQEQWNPYGEGYWHDLLKEAATRFRNQFGSYPHVTDIHHGTYHGGELIVGVTTDLLYPNIISLPDTYAGFRVMQFGRMPRGIIERLLVWYRRKTWTPS
jgi:hypothetical protein